MDECKPLPAVELGIDAFSTGLSFWILLPDAGMRVPPGGEHVFEFAERTDLGIGPDE